METKGVWVMSLVRSTSKQNLLKLALNVEMSRNAIETEMVGGSWSGVRPGIPGSRYMEYHYWFFSN